MDLLGSYAPSPHWRKANEWWDKMAHKFAMLSRDEIGEWYGVNSRPLDIIFLEKQVFGVKIVMIGIRLYILLLFTQ
jgi:hypothetical protein